MKRAWVVLLASLMALVIAAGLMAFRPSVQADSKSKGEAELELIIELGSGADGIPTTIEEVVQAVSNVGSFAVDSFFDITYVSDIGSSGLDGFSVDSFFDITYRIESPSDAKIEIELVALTLRSTLSDPANPGGALDAVKAAVTAAGGKTYYGHVTLIK